MREKVNLPSVAFFDGAHSIAKPRFNRWLVPPAAQTRPSDRGTTFLVLAWLWLAIPLTWGVAVTLQNALKLFQ